MKSKQRDLVQTQVKKRPRATAVRPSPVSTWQQEQQLDHALAGGWSPIEKLPALANTQRLRHGAVLRLQEQQGNTAVLRRLQLSRIQLLDEEEVRLPTDGLSVEQELEGHGDLSYQEGVQRETGVATAPPTAGSSTPTANITFNNVTPTIRRDPEADIARRHGRENVAGWCTPHYRVEVPNLTTNTIDITVSLTFLIELATEYSGARLGVLRDHEYGHVTVGTRLAEKHLVDDLQTNLQALPNFTARDPIQTQITAAIDRFVAAEARLSREYDTADYPRMREAYQGADTPLVDLAEASAPIKHMINRLKGFNQYVPNIKLHPGDPKEFGLKSHCYEIVLAYASLSETDVMRLQYNPEFKQLVTITQEAVNKVKKDWHVTSNSDPNLSSLERTLARFNWTPTAVIDRLNWAEPTAGRRSNRRRRRRR